MILLLAFATLLVCGTIAVREGCFWCSLVAFVSAIWLGLGGLGYYALRWLDVF